MEDHGPGVAHDLPPGLRLDRLPAAGAEEGVQAVRPAEENPVLQQRRRQLQPQIDKIVSRQPEQQGLCQVKQDVQHTVAGGGDILLLIGDQQRLLIAGQVGQGRIRHKQEVDEIDMGDLRQVLDEHREKGGRTAAQEGHHAADGPVGPPEQAHQSTDLRPVPLRQRLVQAEGDGAAHAQLRQREHGENVGEGAVQAQVLLGKHQDEHLAGEKGYNDLKRLKKDGKFDVSKAVFGSGHSSPSLLSCIKSGRQSFTVCYLFPFAQLTKFPE